MEESGAKSNRILLRKKTHKNNFQDNLFSAFFRKVENKMQIRAYNATHDTHGGPFATFKEAVKWAEDNLPSVEDDLFEEILEKELMEDGRTMVGEKGGGERMYAEDVVIFDADRYPPDEDGYIDW